MKSRKLLILGYGGHGREIKDVAMHMGIFKKILFLDDNIKDEEVIGNINDFSIYLDEFEYIVGIGDNKSRSEIMSSLMLSSAKLASIVDPSAIISENSFIDVGTVVMPGVIINNNVKVGKGVIINTKSSIDHDSIIEDFVHISPGVTMGGCVRVGNMTWIGIGSSVVHNIEITHNCVIGAGSVIISNINESGLYYGVPAKKVR